MVELPADPAQIPDIIVYLVSKGQAVVEGVRCSTRCLGWRVSLFTINQPAPTRVRESPYRIDVIFHPLNVYAYVRLHPTRAQRFKLILMYGAFFAGSRHTRVSGELRSNTSGRCFGAAVPWRPLLVRGPNELC